MDDEGFDPCECMWNHDMAMQRLLSILRQTQAYCTDNECLSVSRLPGPSSTPSNNFFMMFLMFGMFILMYALRPRSLRSKNKEDMKAKRNQPDSNDDPPTPPPTVN
ncbi:small integral membrane protein 14 [Belonocnema kinseyi]|uniref:small integral membrane protein 14 n=1 Tax=Belonocnema kinseyi TaxID=2817044 RepID=UPI00143D5372|nr:small integral membrane protein 14 [Belonocnema kinseyi]